MYSILFFFLSDISTASNGKQTESGPSTEAKIELNGLEPNRNYTCVSQVFYNHHQFTNKTETIETLFKSECTTYISM